MDSMVDQLDPLRAIDHRANKSERSAGEASWYDLPQRHVAFGMGSDICNGAAAPALIAQAALG